MGKPNFFKKFLSFLKWQLRREVQPSVPWNPSACFATSCRSPLPLSSAAAQPAWERKWKDSGNYCHSRPALREQESSYCHAGSARQALDFCASMVIRKQNLKSQFWLRTLCPIFSWPWLWMAWSILNLIYNDGPCEAGKCYVNTP